MLSACAEHDGRGVLQAGPSPRPQAAPAPGPDAAAGAGQILAGLETVAELAHLPQEAVQAIPKELKSLGAVHAQEVTASDSKAAGCSSPGARRRCWCRHLLNASAKAAQRSGTRLS